MDNFYWVIINNEELLNFGFLFHTSDEAYKFAQEHMREIKDWQVAKIKLYKVL